MNAWDKVLEATEKHNIDRIDVVLADGKSWTSIQCQCTETFSEEWEFTDHIRRLVFDALKPAALMEPLAESVTAT